MMEAKAHISTTVTHVDLENSPQLISSLVSTLLPIAPHLQPTPHNAKLATGTTLLTLLLSFVLTAKMEVSLIVWIVLIMPLQLINIPAQLVQVEKSLLLMANPV